jgi:hypothetical protein
MDRCAGQRGWGIQHVATKFVAPHKLGRLHLTQDGVQVLGFLVKLRCQLRQSDASPLEYDPRNGVRIIVSEQNLCCGPGHLLVPYDFRELGDGVKLPKVITEVPLKISLARTGKNRGSSSHLREKRLYAVREWLGKNIDQLHVDRIHLILQLI